MYKTFQPLGPPWALSPHPSLGRRSSQAPGESAGQALNLAGRVHPLSCCVLFCFCFCRVWGGWRTLVLSKHSPSAPSPFWLTQCVTHQGPRSDYSAPLGLSGRVRLSWIRRVIRNEQKRISSFSVWSGVMMIKLNHRH